MIEHPKYSSEGRRFDMFESYWKHSEFFSLSMPVAFIEYTIFHHSKFVYKLSLAATRFKKKKKKKKKKITRGAKIEEGLF